MYIRLKQKNSTSKQISSILRCCPNISQYEAILCPQNMLLAPRVKLKSSCTVINLPGQQEMWQVILIFHKFRRSAIVPGVSEIDDVMTTVGVNNGVLISSIHKFFDKQELYNFPSKWIFWDLLLINVI